MPVAVTGGVTFASVSAGDGFTCGVSTAGDAYRWGKGLYGRSDAPTPVSGGHHFVQVSAGANHACGVTTERAVYCWGVNRAGQLGSGDTVSSLAPRPVASRAPFSQIHDFVSVSARGHHTCGLSVRGVMYCWGDNFHSQIGEEPSHLASWVPVAVATGHRVSAVSAGALHTCALTLASIDRVSCWGGNQDYQLGVRRVVTGDQVLISERIFRGIAFVQLDAGDYHTCGTTEEGAVYCWGRNTEGQLGDGTLRVPVRPARVAEPDSTID